MTKEELLSEFEKNPMTLMMDSFTKSIAVEMFKIAIDITQKEHGDNYTIIDVYKEYTALLIMTDPNNKTSPFAMEKIEKN